MNFNQLPIEFPTPTQPITSHTYCYVYQNREGESIQVNYLNQICEIAAKSGEFAIQNMPLMNWRKCNYV